MNIAVTCAALLGLLLFGLGLFVSTRRFKSRQGIGYDLSPTDPLHRAVRAHANTAEYAPFLAVLFLWFATRPIPDWIAATIVVATVARYLLVAGLLWGGRLDRPNPARFLGALLTYICGMVLAVGLFVV
ncbi:MAG: MAPEG family protein [Bradyrhizobium sp.]|uniref:MAPEG family protein n=1 Tax=Bradyrhizobium sp. TaxID=376 RepID=UPI0025C158D0|nr:MAPEG family protein [Bradyrhizobium sp.]MBI5260972.1 MAPEG family protein [Bradyrhizobium sp.]